MPVVLSLFITFLLSAFFPLRVPKARLSCLFPLLYRLIIALF